MKLTAFKITNFRSIVESSWVPFSPDGITVLVGQNESGKSSVLEGLYFALTDNDPSEDDFRTGASLPTVNLKVQLEDRDIDQYFSEFLSYQVSGLKQFLHGKKQCVEITCRWDYEHAAGKRTIERLIEIQDAELQKLIEAAKKHDEAKTSSVADTHSTAEQPQTSAPAGEQPTSQDGIQVAPERDEPDIAYEIWRSLPLGVLFNEESGRLPSQVDIDEKSQPTGQGSQAALNFLKIAEIDLPALLKGDRRARENTLNKANSRVSENFNSFWSQTIGKSGRLTLKCDIDHYGSEHGDKAGRPHLVFWICDGTTQLYPKQRSQGVRWFVSFYLQLKASEKSKNRRVFLLDEPGSNLHSKAQADVLKLINQLGKETSSVVYSTHSPQMLEYPKLFRVHAVQRNGDRDESPTQIIDAHHLGTASTDTLSPVLTAMGADLSQHQVIRKSNNVLLEEMSGFYYIKSFWKLLAAEKEAHFIAATGVNKIEALANMFRGWGLDFIVAVDDDKQGREAYNSMKRELFGDDADLAAEKMVKLPNCVAIEDALSKDDFIKFVLKDPGVNFNSSNAEYVKTTGRSKPVLAFNFSLDVENGKVSFDQLSQESKQRLQAIVEAINSRLN